MNKIGKKIMALLVVLTSIISFFPAEFIGQAANAATTTSSGTTLNVSVSGSATLLTPITDNTGVALETVYSTSNITSGFDLTVDDITTTEDELAKKAKANQASVTGVVGQSVEIVSINDIDLSTTAGQLAKDDLGIKISDAGNLSSSATRRIGKEISLPLGINKVVYRISKTTQTVDYKSTTSTDSNGNTTTTGTTIPSTPVTETYSDEKITICHATGFTTTQVQSMLVKAYVGAFKYFDSNDDISDEAQKENNKSPFLYNTQANPDTGFPLRYTFNVPDSTNALKYVMKFDTQIDLNGATLYKNGKLANEGTDYTNSGNSITGSLTNLQSADSADFIVIKINSTSSSDTTAIGKTYSIQVRYTTKNADVDYTIYDAGLTKGNYANDDSVKAYVGKVFLVAKPADNPSANYNEYTGDIYISKKAGTISIDPTLVVDKNVQVSSQRTLAYIVSNQYNDSSGNKKSANSTLINGKQYVDFNAGSTNQLYVDVYNNGNQGSVTSSSVLVARYILNVTVLDEISPTFSMGLAFDDDSSTDSTYLTQPGIKGNQMSFKESRLTYDLYTTENNKIKVSFTGDKSSNNEYLKFWTATGVNSNSFKTATVNQSGDDYTIDLTGAKKMMVQAYYNSTTGAAASYPASDNQYVFYLPNNYDSSDTSTNTGNTSNNASLNNLKINSAALTDSDGNTGFSSSVYGYTATVNKGDTTAKITATAQDDNVKSIVATVKDNGTTYNLTSGEVSDITLDTDGITTVQIVATAQDGVTTKTYTVIISNNTKSGNANLKSVILNTGDYKFDSSADTTKVRVSQNTTSINVTPVPEDYTSTVTVNGETYSSSAITVSLKGSQKIDIEIIVKSEDGTVSKTYTLEVYRTDSTNWNSDGSDNSNDDDQYYDEYSDCWVDTTKYDEWGTVNGNPVYFDKNNRQVKNAWVSNGGKYYYLNNSGYRASGWKVDSTTGQTYYLDLTTGEMKKGWINLNNNWYYLGLNGVMHKGWLYLNGKWYYFTPNGLMVVNQSMYVDDKVYNFGQDGAVIA